MPQMRALRRHGWNQGEVNKGASYEATEQEAQLLETLDWAVRISAPPARATYQTADMRAQPVPRGTTNRAQRRQQTRAMSAPD